MNNRRLQKDLNPWPRKSNPDIPNLQHAQYVRLRETYVYNSSILQLKVLKGLVCGHESLPPDSLEVNRVTDDKLRFAVDVRRRKEPRNQATGFGIDHFVYGHSRNLKKCLQSINKQNNKTD